MPPSPSLDLRIRTRMGLTALAGVAAALLVPVPARESWVASALIGFAVFGVLFSLPLLAMVMRIGPDRTADYLTGADPTRSLTDVLAVVASVASLGGVAYMLVGGGSGNKVFEAVVTIGVVAAGWLLIHTMYTIRYARHWYNAERGSVDFNDDAAPRFSDFAYLSFTLGMTYQVSDTDLKTPAVRKIVLHHTLLSYVFGTVIVAATINLIVGLAK